MKFNKLSKRDEVYDATRTFRPNSQISSLYSGYFARPSMQSFLRLCKGLVLCVAVLVMLLICGVVVLSYTLTSGPPKPVPRPFVIFALAMLGFLVCVFRLCQFLTIRYKKRLSDPEKNCQPENVSTQPNANTFVGPREFENRDVDLSIPLETEVEVRANNVASPRIVIMPDDVSPPSAQSTTLSRQTAQQSRQASNPQQSLRPPTPVYHDSRNKRSPPRVINI